jgi:hypothetical protein
VSAVPGTEVPADIDIHTTAGKLADLDRRIDAAVHAASEKAVEKQHAKGKMTRANGSRNSSTRGPSSSSMNSPGTAQSPSGWRRPVRTATASSPATAPSTAVRHVFFPRTSLSSAARSARSTARRSPR